MAMNLPKDWSKGPDWLDKAKDPSHGSDGMGGFILAIVLIVGGACAFLFGMFTR